MDTDRNATRRMVLGTLAAATASAMLDVRAHATDAAGNIMVEWNQHMFCSDVARFPFNPRATYRGNPAHYPVDPLASYMKTLTQEGVDRAVLVQPEPYGDDHSLILDCLRRAPADRFKGTSLFYPRDADAPDKLAALVQREPRIVSTRFHKLKNNTKYMDSFADPGVRALWKRAVDLGLVIELHIGPQFGREVADTIAAIPGSRVLIDHLAEPQTGDAIDYAGILDLAKLPNVYMKLSELESMAKDAPYFESLLPFTRRVIREYGPDRMVWSGGSPHIADVHFEGYSEADLAKVRGGNLRRLLAWK